MSSISSIKKVLSTDNIVLTLFLVYNMQGIFYESGGVVSQSLIFLVILISFISFIKVIVSFSGDKIVSIWATFIFLNIFYYFISGNWSRSLDVNHLKGILCGMLPFFIFYDSGRKGKDLSKNFKSFFIIALIVTIASYYRNKSQFMIEYQTENVVNNIAYSFIPLIPFIFLFKGKIILQYGFLLLIAIFIIFGSKRGAIVSGVFSMGCFMYYVYRDTSNKSIYKKILLFALSLIVVYITYYTFLENNFVLRRFELVSEGQTSNRDVIYRMIWNYWLNTPSVVNALFGFGFVASVKITGRYLAHNDWLEVLSNMGLLGIIFYALLMYQSYKLKIRFKTSSIWYQMIVTIMITWIVMTIFTTRYNGLVSIYSNVLIGYIAGLAYRNKKLSINC